MDGAKGGAIAAVFIIVGDLLGGPAAAFVLMSVWLGAGAWIVHRRTPLRSLALTWLVLAGVLSGFAALSATGRALSDLVSIGRWQLALAVGFGALILMSTVFAAANRADSRRHPHAWAAWLASLKEASLWDVLTFRQVPHLR